MICCKADDSTAATAMPSPSMLICMSVTVLHKQSASRHTREHAVSGVCVFEEDQHVDLLHKPLPRQSTTVID